MSLMTTNTSISIRHTTLVQLLAYTTHPSSIIKCIISDIYALKVLIEEQSTSYAPHGDHPLEVLMIEIFMLDKRPCRSVELVAWVAGVDLKESSMIVTRQSS